eukprot:2225585-Amphidinium_carterae.1
MRLYGMTWAAPSTWVVTTIPSFRKGSVCHSNRRPSGAFVDWHPGLHQELVWERLACMLVNPCEVLAGLALEEGGDVWQLRVPHR